MQDAKNYKFMQPDFLNSHLRRASCAQLINKHRYEYISIADLECTSV